jgi:hypoxanthine-DNA glycosylase
MFEHDFRRDRDGADDAGSMCISLAPVWRADARILLLGSMPGQRSLQAQSYYAHPRNAFWVIVEALFEVPADSPYRQRLAGLVDAGVALWDVIGRCRRRGSLDQRIETGTVEPNDLAGLLRRCPQIERIGFNGAAAEAAFGRHVLPALEPRLAAIERSALDQPGARCDESRGQDRCVAGRPAVRRWREPIGANTVTSGLRHLITIAGLSD